MHTIRAMGIGCGVAVLLTACEPVSESERRYLEARDQEVEARREFMQSLAEGNSISDAISLVKTNPAPQDENLTTEAWLNQAREELIGNVLFVRWDAHRRGPQRYEVRYTYTHIDQEYNIHYKGQAWDVDTMLKTVSLPYELPPEELEPRQRSGVPDRPLLTEPASSEFSLE